MINIASIVEGEGEVAALPLLLRRLNAWQPSPVGSYANPVPPIRVRRDRFLNREEEFRRQLLLAAAKCGEDGWILVVLDADDDCPAEIAENILQRARQHIAHRRLSVILAKREFEAWFIAAAHSLHGHRNFYLSEDEEIDPEMPRDAKGWLRDHIANGKYRETVDQPAFVSQIDLQQAFDNSRSFRKLCKEWSRNV